MEPLPKDDDHNAGRRAREVYRYFRPERLAPIDENQSLNSEEPVLLEPSARRGSATSSRPTSISQSLNSSRSGSLTSWTPPLAPMPNSLVLGDSNETLHLFAQLAALRLNVDRVFISVSDRKSQFIIAQAAQNTKDNGKYDFLSGGVYSGSTTLDVSSWTPCQDTIALPQSNREQDEYDFVVSNDMKEDERYKNLPFVQKEPNFRFYAGTPLTTDSNINVGCLFVLDTKPHVEFTHSEKETMGTMGMLIMDFLKVSRQASEGRRAARLSRGLSCFVEGRSELTEVFDDPTMHSPSPHPTSRPTSQTPSSHLSNSNNQLPRGRSHSRGSDTRSITSLSDVNTDQSRGSSVASHFPVLRSGSMNIPDEDDEYQGTAGTFQRAANIIRASLELEGESGVVFVQGGNDMMAGFDTRSEVSGSFENSKSATVLAISAGEAPIGPETESLAQYPVSGIDDGFLHGLLCRYGQGKLWSIHRDGLFSSSDSDESANTSRQSRARERSRTTKAKRAKKWKTVENKMLNQYFPGASQVIFVPLWNSNTSQWFGGCFCWNNVENVVFDQHVELSSLLGFGSSIMAECNRIESQMSDRQKADFLGSVSHELRSPLHGILAAAELLQGTECDDFQSSLLGTINACGRTLLDTMNQVLDYTKLVSLEKDLHQLNRNRPSSVNLKSMQRSASQLDAYMPIDLSLLAEEVVEGVCLGHSYSQRPALSSPAGTPPLNSNTSQSFDIPQMHVDIDMDIAHHNWVYSTPPGALRRIIMNIFSNAIKYTDSGRVSLRLEVKEASDTRTQQQGTKEDTITLTVTDTGRGISEEFLRGKLFIPFAQENSLAVGTGLGLSIVRSLLKSLGGNITVDSRPDEGTTVKVTIPLARHEPNLDGISSPIPSPGPELEPESISTEVRLLRDAHAGRTIAILGVEPENASTHPQWGAFSRYLTDWYGLKLVSSLSKAPIDAILVSELPLKEHVSWDTESKQAILVLSPSFVGPNSAQPEWSSTNTVITVNRPYGPHKLSRFIHKCLDQAFPLPATELVVLPKKEEILLPTPLEDVTSHQPVPQADDMQVSAPEDISHALPPLHNTLPSSTTPEFTENTEPIPEEPRKPRILVVEDNKINLNLMLTFLKKRKLDTVHSAENGQLAVNAVEKLQPGYDIIFMDISMPVMDGFDAARYIRALEQQRDRSNSSVIIALTGLSGSTDEFEALNSGMDLFLTKPVAFKEVSKILDKWSEGGLREPDQPESDLPDS